MTFLIVALALASVYVLVARRCGASLFRCLLVPALFSLFVTLHLGLNYVAGMDNNPEGIGLTSTFLLWIFGDSNWSAYWFGNAFRVSSWISLALLIATAVASLARRER